MPPWEIISEKLDKQIHSPLHTAGYFLNPKYHYSPGFRGDIKVKRGLENCITRMVADPEERAKIKIQLDDFDKRAGFLGDPVAVRATDTWNPSHWWNSFGYKQSELQKLAIRILSLTCSSYGGEHNQSAFEMVHTKRIHHLRQKTRNDVVFVTTNSKLAEKKQY